MAYSKYLNDPLDEHYLLGKVRISHQTQKNAYVSD